MKILRHNDDDLGFTVGSKPKKPNDSLEGVLMTHEGLEAGALECPTEFTEGEGLSNCAPETPRNYWPAQLQRRKCRPSWNAPRLAALILVGTNSSFVRAAPVQSASDSSLSARTHWLRRRGISANTWIPVVAICGFTVILIAWTCWRRRRTVASLLRHRAIIIEPGNGGRELTADDLAGTNNGAGTQEENNNNAPAPTPSAPRTRRNRRARRTPSQISTHSLPEYAKEPGAQELVVLQGALEEDVPIPQPLVTVIQLDEDESDTTESRPTSRYTQVPDTPADAPLLQDDTTGDPDQPTSTEVHRRSGSTGNRDEANSLEQADSQAPLLHSRAEAPPYFEVIDRPGTGGSGVARGFIDAGPHNAPASPVPSENASPPASPQPGFNGTAFTSHRPGSSHSVLASYRPGSSHSALVSPRPGSSHSGFRAMFGQRSPPGSPTHFRNASSTSVISSHSHYRSHTRGPSAGSILTTFRPLARQKSIASYNSGSRANLTSPSLISLNSISAPLTHTAVRTEITFPKSGPTPEQLRLIASVDGLKRFGIPYGPDAVAFSSLSRENLAGGDRPPEFETVTSGNGSGGEASTGTAVEPTGSASSETARPHEASVNDQSLGEGSSPTSSHLRVEQTIHTPNTEGILPTCADLLLEETMGSDEVCEDNTAKDEVGGVELEGKGKGKANEAVEDVVRSAGRVDHESVVQGEPVILDTTSAAWTPKLATSLCQPTSFKDSPADAHRTNLSAPEAMQEKLTSSSTSSPPRSTASESVSPLPSPPSPPNTTSTTASPPSSYYPPRRASLRPDGDFSPLERPESRASQLSYASYTSYASNGTFRTATESLRSRKHGKQPNMTDDEDDDTVEGYDTADDGNVTEGGEDSRPSTPTPGGNMVSARHGRESTDSTVSGLTPLQARLRQDRHLSTATITQASVA